LIQWIQNPQAIDPENAMPDVGVTEEDARHIAAYLPLAGDCLLRIIN
jgi:cytochrome c